MNILWLSWRDIKNPKSGGAEKVAFEISKRASKNGINITIFTSTFKNSKPIEIASNVNIIRKGNLFTCRVYAFWHYLKNPNKYDLVIDEINTLPFFTPIFAKNKSVTLIHQLAKEIWFREMHFPVNYLGYLLEPLYLNLYKGTLTIAASTSTKKDLQKLKFKKIVIYKEGLDFKALTKVPKKNKNNLIFVGRMTESKGIFDIIETLSIIKKRSPRIKLYLVGYGEKDLIDKIKAKIKKLKLTNSIVLCGYVSSEKKISLLKKSKLLLVPSIREGWNLAVIEANALGTPSIGYKVPGLVDSIKHNKTGLLVKANPETLAQQTLLLLNNEAKWEYLANNALKFSNQFDWNKTYKSFIKYLDL